MWLFRLMNLKNKLHFYDQIWVIVCWRQINGVVASSITRQGLHTIVAVSPMAHYDLSLSYCNQTGNPDGTKQNLDGLTFTKSHAATGRKF